MDVLINEIGQIEFAITKEELKEKTDDEIIDELVELYKKYNKLCYKHYFNIPELEIEEIINKIYEDNSDRKV